MRLFILALFFVAYSTDSFSQTTIYYKDKYLSRKTGQKKGKYSKTVYTKNDTIVIEVKNLRKNILINRELTLSSGEQVGLWEYEKKGYPFQFDYNFEVKYANKKCADTVRFTDNNNKQFIDKLSTFLANNLRYPKSARAQNISGKVYYYLNFDSNGNLLEIFTNKGISISLDKEGSRVIKKFFKKNLWPTKRDSSFCYVLPIVFSMGE